MGTFLPHRALYLAGPLTVMSKVPIGWCYCRSTSRALIVLFIAVVVVVALIIDIDQFVSLDHRITEKISRAPFRGLTDVRSYHKTEVYKWPLSEITHAPILPKTLLKKRKGRERKERERRGGVPLYVSTMPARGPRRDWCDECQHSSRGVFLRKEQGEVERSAIYAAQHLCRVWHV